MSQLETLYLENITQWNTLLSRKILAKMNLKYLTIHFDDNIKVSSNEKISIPQSVIDFSINRSFRMDEISNSQLISLKLCIENISDLIPIIEHTPNLQRLFVNFASYSNKFISSRNIQRFPFELMMEIFQPLQRLTYLSI